ncbi:MAG: hypothetical protein A3F16_03985 [Deltaproteobacteria bacterium RIFCSPHIGHO2_12_FULL_43_9]|nr:MAG: hypothetical protein A3F16_03985 [Deltaproteobacteria bacterium RIFCSPHIGHO2_12_FULL_43_9]
MAAALTEFLYGTTVLIIYLGVYYFLIYNLLNTFILIMAARWIFRQHLGLSKYIFSRLKQSRFLPGVSMIMPAHNEEETAVKSARFMLFVDYPLFEVIIVNDGSTDGTMQYLIEAYQLESVPVDYNQAISSKPIKAIYRSRVFPNLTVIDKEQGGKSDALLKIMQPVINKPAEVIASGGVVRIAEGIEERGGRIIGVKTPNRIISLTQVVEYLRAFLWGRIGFSAINSLLIISGAFGLFRRDAVVEVGGYSTKHIGEDMELIARLHKLFCDKKRKYQIAFLPDPVCWTHGPTDYKTLYKQRTRWQRGLGQVLFTHRGLLFNPHYKTVGWCSFPHFVFFEFLGPLFELLVYLTIPLAIFLKLISPQMIVILFLSIFVFTLSVTLATVVLDQLAFPHFTRVRDIVKIMAGAVIETFVIRFFQTCWKAYAVLTLFFRWKRKW